MSSSPCSTIPTPRRTMRCARPGRQIWGLTPEHGWRKILHDGMIAGTAFQPKTVSAKIGDLAVTAAQRAGRNRRSHLPCRPQRLRRALCQRRLATGNSQASHQHVVGQRGADELPHAGKIRLGGAGRGGHQVERQHGVGSGPGGSRSRRRLGHGVPGLWAPEWGPRGRRVGL